MSENKDLRSHLVFIIVASILLFVFFLASYYGKLIFYDLNFPFVNTLMSWKFYVGLLFLLPLINVFHKFIMNKTFKVKPK